jgi:hypothetical protein
MSTNSVSTAVTNVTPARKGRAPIMLKGGVSLADARIKAKIALADAKIELRNAKTLQTGVEKSFKTATKQTESKQKDLAKAEAAFGKLPQNATKQQKTDAKASVNVAKAELKTAQAEVKRIAKELEAAVKAVSKKAEAVTKAEAARLKVEESKLPKAA